MSKQRDREKKPNRAITESKKRATALRKDIDEAQNQSKKAKSRVRPRARRTI
jgi:hypothetical protein